MFNSKLAHSDENAKKPAVFLTVEELMSIFGSMIEAKLDGLKIMSQIPPSAQEVRLNFNQAVDFLQISKPTFVKLRKEGKIKGVRVGERRILFNRSELESYLQSNHE